ncbi:NAD-dependent epimerase/dehydratase family protein [Nonomuraea endophytica]|uniref:Nucleoside-diphosphate-sugar epimerase n=1 Tax=Nonomuraea endophytica TaxID=714136 RepID=A0A7W8AAD3_9ACTN|nr:NAD-dependent epimerase/dehydratase family protein [Nonomuraea endophytica]MBB5082529.1 nucleoside-diphosphate-sugar epimerase [Nonomuraea endophytica]
MNEICVIGGSRYFGRRLIENLRDHGARVTVVNRGSSTPPEGVTHLRADRGDEEAMRLALAGRSFDAVVDQVCYTPRHAAVARRVFEGKTRRYVMTSTVEVYADLGGGAPYREDALDFTAGIVRADLLRGGERHYGAGKRLAEAVLRSAGFVFTAVRTAHVLGGDDFTGRLDHYVRRVDAGVPVGICADPRPASFIHEREIAAFLAWAALGDFSGPVNACSHGTLDVRRLCETIGRPLYTRGDSPYSFERDYTMDNGRATTLGFRFSNVGDWLPGVVRETRAYV